MPNTQAVEYGKVAPKSEKPDYKLSEMANKKVTIVRFSSKEQEYNGQTTTFRTAFMADGKSFSINQAIFKQLEAIKDKLPVITTISPKKNAKGQTYYVLA